MRSHHTRRRRGIARVAMHIFRPTMRRWSTVHAIVIHGAIILGTLVILVHSIVVITMGRRWMAVTWIHVRRWRSIRSISTMRWWRWFIVISTTWCTFESATSVSSVWNFDSFRGGKGCFCSSSHGTVLRVESWSVRTTHTVSSLIVHGKFGGMRIRIWSRPWTSVGILL
jgi:hypothetical protein